VTRLEPIAAEQASLGSVLLKKNPPAAYSSGHANPENLIKQTNKKEPQGGAIEQDKPTNGKRIEIFYVLYPFL